MEKTWKDNNEKSNGNRNRSNTEDIEERSCWSSLGSCRADMVVVVEAWVKKLV